MKSIYLIAVLLVLAVSVSDARRNRGCKYMKTAVWSDCDPVTRTKTRSLQPKPKNRPDCLEPKLVTKSCDVCRYEQATVGACDPITSTLEVRKALAVGTSADLNCEAFKIKTKKCKINKALKCQYGHRVIGDCDQTSNTRLITFPLLAGQDPNCTPKNKTKPCKRLNKNKTCKYDKSDWDMSACPGGSATRTLTLAAGQDATMCEQTRVKTVRCKRLDKKMDKKSKNRENREGRKEKKKQRRQEKRRQNRKNAGPGSPGLIDANA